MVFIIFSCAFSNEKYKETFVVERFRPIERKIRYGIGNLYDNLSKRISNILRRNGIM